MTITLGAGFSAGSEWLTAYQDFREAAKDSLDTIAVATQSTLRVRTDEDMGRLGETSLLINTINTAAPISVWCKTGVSNATVVIDIVLNPNSWTESTNIARRIAQMRETLAHEWVLHGERLWSFIQWIRTQPSETGEDLEAIEEKYNDAGLWNGDMEHDELAAGTHERFTAVMSKLIERNAENEELAAALRQAWDDDVKSHKKDKKGKGEKKEKETTK